MENREGLLVMVQPYIIQPDYVNAMVQGLSTNLAYIAESKKGGGGIRVSGGGGKKEKSGVVKAKEASDKLVADLAKENKERNEMYKERQAEEDKTNLMAERQEKETTAKGKKDESEAKKNFSEQFFSYAPAVTQKNYNDWIKFGEENNFKHPFLAKPEEVSNMKPEEFKAYMGGLSKKKESAGFHLEEKKELERYKAGLGDKQTSSEKRQRMKLAVDAEDKILNPENKGKVQLKGQVDLFNTYSKEPYVYAWNEGEKVPIGKGTLGLGLDKKPLVTKIKLPVINGIQLTAEDVAFTAEEEGMSIDEVLKQIGAMK